MENHSGSITYMLGGQSPHPYVGPPLKGFAPQEIKFRELKYTKTLAPPPRKGYTLQLFPFCVCYIVKSIFAVAPLD